MTGTVASCQMYKRSATPRRRGGAPDWGCVTRRRHATLHFGMDQSRGPLTLLVVGERHVHLGVVHIHGRWFGTAQPHLSRPTAPGQKHPRCTFCRSATDISPLPGYGLRNPSGGRDVGEHMGASHAAAAIGRAASPEHDRHRWRLPPCVFPRQQRTEGNAVGDSSHNITARIRNVTGRVPFRIRRTAPLPAFRIRALATVGVTGWADMPLPWRRVGGTAPRQFTRQP